MRTAAYVSETGKYLSCAPEISSTGTLTRPSPASGESSSIFARTSSGKPA